MVCAILLSQFHDSLGDSLPRPQPGNPKRGISGAVLSGENIMTIESAVRDHEQAAVQFLELVVAGKIDEAYRKFAAPDGKHHNPLFAAGFPALREAMKENNVQFPNKRLNVKHV